MGAKKPDIVVMDKKEGKCLIKDMACLFNIIVSEKEKEKLEKYQDLKKELKRRSHYRFREYWRPCNGVNEPEEMVTGARRSQGTRAATECMPLGNSKDP